MPSLRDIQESFFHELRTVILPDWGYIENITGEALTSLGSLAYSFGNGNIAYANIQTGDIDPSGVAVYDAARRLELSEYSVDYIDSQVTLNATPSGAVTSDYSYYTINTLDAFPDNEAFETTDLPIVTVEFTDRVRNNFAIAQRGSWWVVGFFIDIFARNEGMRLDLMDRLQVSLSKWLRITDFSDGYPLSYDGTINTDFSIDDQFSTWIKQVDPKTASKVTVPYPTDKEKFRARIPGTIKYVQ
jgi:hypothetical protein